MDSEKAINVWSNWTYLWKRKVTRVNGHKGDQRQWSIRVNGGE